MNVMEIFGIKKILELILDDVTSSTMFYYLFELNIRVLLLKNIFFCIKIRILKRSKSGENKINGLCT